MEQRNSLPELLCTVNNENRTFSMHNALKKVLRKDYNIRLKVLFLPLRCLGASRGFHDQHVDPDPEKTKMQQRYDSTGLPPGSACKGMTPYKYQFRLVHRDGTGVTVVGLRKLSKELKCFVEEWVQHRQQLGLPVPQTPAKVVTTQDDDNTDSDDDVVLAAHDDHQELTPPLPPPPPPAATPAGPAAPAAAPPRGAAGSGHGRQPSGRADKSAGRGRAAAAAAGARLGAKRLRGGSGDAAAAGPPARRQHVEGTAPVLNGTAALLQAAVNNPTILNNDKFLDTIRVMAENEGKHKDIELQHVILKTKAADTYKAVLDQVKDLTAGTGLPGLLAVAHPALPAAEVHETEDEDA